MIYVVKWVQGGVVRYWRPGSWADTQAEASRLMNIEARALAKVFDAKVVCLKGRKQ